MTGCARAGCIAAELTHRSTAKGHSSHYTRCHNAATSYEQLPPNHPRHAQDELARFIQEYAATATGPTKWEKLAEFLKDTYPQIANEVGSMTGGGRSLCLHRLAWRALVQGWVACVAQWCVCRVSYGACAPRWLTMRALAAAMAGRGGSSRSTRFKYAHHTPFDHY